MVAGSAAVVRAVRNVEVPDLIVVDALLEAVAQPRAARPGIDLRMAARCNVQLERAARALAKDVPRCLNASDPVTSQWLSGRALGMAASIRQLKMALLTPREGSRAYVEDEIWRRLDAILTGRFDELAWTDVSHTGDPGDLRTRVGSWVRTFVIVLGPLIALSIVQLTAFAIERPYADWLRFGAVIWALVSLMIRLDPLFTATLDAAGKLRSALPGSGDKEAPDASKPSL